MRRFLAAVPVTVAVLVVLAVGGPAARAAQEWCDTDPLVLIRTPGGALVPVYVTTGALGAEHLPAVLAARIGYAAQPVQGGDATLVHLEVLVPGDQFDSHFATRSVASSGPLGSGTVYATDTGFSGQVMTLVFILAVP